MIYDRIAAKAKEQNLSLSEVERKAGVSQGYISKLKQDGANPTVFKVYLIANALGCNLYDLLEG